MMSEHALSRLTKLHECLRRCRFDSERIEFILGAVSAATWSYAGGKYRNLPESRSMAAALALCGFTDEEVDRLVDAMLEAGCAAAGATRERWIALLRAAPIPELPN
jgi:hypothetical protein